jgi:hypothetical protein
VNLAKNSELVVHSFAALDSGLEFDSAVQSWLLRDRSRDNKEPKNIRHGEKTPSI